MLDQVGIKIHQLAQELWPLNRSLTGHGVRSTLLKIKQHLPQLQITEVPSGTPAFDWIVVPLYFQWERGGA
jgi:aminopeptidase-like protein